MQNRSFLTLPSFYVHAEPGDLSERSAEAGPLEVFDITYLHFHSVLELGVCFSGRGTCVVEGERTPFEQGDVQVVFPFQRHLSRSEGGEYSRWLWTSLNPMQLLSAWGAPELPRMERLLQTRMSLCGIIDRREHPLIAELVRSVALPGESRRRTACLCALIEELAAASEGRTPLALQPERSFVRLEPRAGAGAAGAGAGPRAEDRGDGRGLRHESRSLSPGLCRVHGPVAAPVRPPLPDEEGAADAAAGRRVDHRRGAGGGLRGRVRLQPPVFVDLWNAAAGISPLRRTN